MERNEHDANQALHANHEIRAARLGQDGRLVEERDLNMIEPPEGLGQSVFSKTIDDRVETASEPAVFEASGNSFDDMLAHLLQKKISATLAMDNKEAERIQAMIELHESRRETA